MLLAQENELSRAEGATEGTPSSAQTTQAARYKSAIVRVCSGSLIRRHELSIHFKSVGPRSGELRTQKLKSHLVRTQSLNVLPL